MNTSIASQSKGREENCAGMYLRGLSIQNGLCESNILDQVN